MNPIKKIIIEEAAKVLREVKKEKKVSPVKSNLFEAIKTADIVKNNPKKYRIAKKLIAISENKFIKERNRLKEEHGPEDESEMAKAQLAAIMEKSNELYRMLDGVTHLEDWLQYKLSIAENYIDAVHGYMKYFNGVEDMEDNVKDEMEWDEVEEEEYDDQDAWDETDIEDADDFDDFDDFDDDDEEYYDEEDFDDFDEEGI